MSLKSIIFARKRMVASLNPSVFKKMKHTTLLLLFVLLPFCGRAQLVINEIMQSNIDGVMDDLNAFPDSWVELHNWSSGSVELKGWRLGTDRASAHAWTLPKGTLKAGGYQLIYCDKEAQDWHTDFRLESGKGCTLYLFRGDVLVDSLPGEMKKQPAPGIAWGRRDDDADVWGWQYQPTPGAANCGVLTDKLLGEPVFSAPSQVLVGVKSMNVSIALPADAPQGTVIRYTSDGSEPTSTSSVWGGVPITISTTRILRAKLFCDGWLSPRSITRSYIFFPRSMTLPVISIVTDKRYLTDSKIGIYTDGSYSTSQKNYKYNWRRPIYFELFEGPGAAPVLAQLCETRVQGGASRDCSLKSLAVYAHKRFGEKRFDYEFFPDQKPGLTDFKSIILRNAGNDFDYLYMRDAVIQRTMATHTDLDWQAWRPAVVYMNGVYKGILNIRERSTTENVRSNYGLDDDEIDMIENMNSLKAGTKDNWEAFKAFYNEHGHTWEEYSQWMDCDEYINLMLMNLYYNNQDFPGNNIVSWRPRTEDGRWRWVAKDTDFGLGLYGSSASYNTIAWLHTPDYDADRAWANTYDNTRLFRRLMEDETFHRRFIDRAMIYMGDFLNYEGTWEVWEPMYKQIKTEYPSHRKLINQWWPNYSDELNSARNWAKNRTSSFTQQLADWYALGTPIAVSINPSVTLADFADITLTFNEVPLSKPAWEGKFFAGRDITLQSVSSGARDVTGWVVTAVGAQGSVQTTQYEGSTCSFTVPSCSQLIINARLGTNAIDELPATDAAQSVPADCYGVDGIRREEVMRGWNIVRMPDGSTRKIWVE